MKNDTNTLFYACRLLVVNFSKRAIFFKNSTIFSRDMKCISYTIEDNSFSSKHTNCLLFLEIQSQEIFFFRTNIFFWYLITLFRGHKMTNPFIACKFPTAAEIDRVLGKGGGLHGETLQAWYIWLGFDIYLKKSNLHEAISSIA